MINSFKEHNNRYKKELINGVKLYEHLMLYGYLPDHWVLPPLIKINNKNITGIGDCSVRSPSVLFAPKSKLKWRQFSFIHPNNYQKVCKLLSDIKFNKSLLELNNSKKIFSYSLPQNYKSSNENSEKQIMRWTELQDDLMLNSGKYEYILILDISNCYHTMYTHTIEWAFDGVGEKTFGNSLDMAIRRGMDNRTHGLPVGSAPSHYISEIVLNKIDREIENTVQIKDYIGGRFRDNYYLLLKNKQEAELLLKEIIITLRKYNLDFNSEKTKILKKNEYFDSFWRIDFNEIISKLNLENIKTIIQLPIRKIEVLINLTLRLSEKYNNDKAILDRLLDILEKIEPEYDLYPKYFSLIQRIYQVRTQTLPRVLGMLSLLAKKNKSCKSEFKKFLLNRLDIAYQSMDNFEMMWLLYFFSINEIKETKKIRNYLLKIKLINDPFLNLSCTFYEKTISGNILSHGDIFLDLWKSDNNESMIEAKFNNIMNIEDLLFILKINFITNFYGGGY